MVYVTTKKVLLAGMRDGAPVGRGGVGGVDQGGLTHGGQGGRAAPLAWRIVVKPH